MFLHSKYHQFIYEKNNDRLNNFCKRFCAIIILVVFFFSQPLISQTAKTFDPVLANLLQTRLDNSIQGRNLIGASAAAFVPGQGVWVGTSGYSVPAQSDTILPSMLFGIGSITKTYTAAILLDLIEDGVLSLEDSLHQWIPNFQYVDSTITIRQILKHTSGIYNYTNNPGFFGAVISDPNYRWSPEEILTSYLFAPNFPPGAAWDYSNTGFTIAGMIIKAATGMEVASYLHSNILGPQNILNTFIEAEDTLTGEVVHHWFDIDGDGDLDDIHSWPREGLYSAAWTAGAIMATAEDVARWGHLLYSASILSQTAINEMTGFYPLNFHPFTGYGLGTMRSSYAGKTLWGHNGGIFGFSSSLFYFPEDSASFAIILNQNGDAEAINAEIFETYLNYTPTGIKVSENPLIKDFHLFQNYPNPFNPQTTIKYSLNVSAKVKLTIYNTMGEVIKTLVDEQEGPGVKEVRWDGVNNNGKKVASGMYLYTLKVNNRSEFGKMVLLK